ncbi:DUF4179 domain-containing protein [Oceanobacillus sp. CFH 90083]|uniref:DUF4179 domain-containing protein n=1 Tax=Oceanobacillus sp. CFH 90083 TaxID=2592336 RepID=UPI00128E788D|nr:DUF4179 domain-containing protein [Oceanobacillus sp. CFH 90083]
MKKRYEHSDPFPEEQVRSAIQTGMEQAEKQRSKGNIHRQLNRINKVKRKVFYAFGSVAVVFVILVGSSYYSPALASSLSQIPIIGSVFGNSDLIGLEKAQKQGLTSQIGETQTIDGISVTLDEILYDQNNITIGYIIESEKQLGEHYFGAGMDFTINGESPSMGSGSYREDIQSATTRTAIQEINVTEEMPDSFELGLILHGGEEETWYFSTPIEKITDIRTIPIEHSQSVDGIDLTVTELTLSETGVSVSYESSEAGTDFELSRGGDIEFRMFDQDGNEITSYSGGGTGELVDNRLVFTSKKQFDPIGSNVTELTITPYTALPTDGGGVEIDENGVEKALEFRGGSLEDVEFESFKVEIPN